MTNTQNNQTNPLLTITTNINTNFDFATPFDKIKVEHYLPALEFAISEAKKQIQAIKGNTQEPNFENVIEALEQSGELVEQVSGVYFNLFSAEANTELQALAKDISPLLAAYGSDISLDEALFNKVKMIWDKKENLNLSSEQKMVLEKTYKSFVRNGALLNKADKEKLRTLDQELSVLSPKFSENILKATNAFEMWLDDLNDLKGLPESAIEAAEHEASSKAEKKGKYLVTLQYPSYIPFMQYAENRNLREKLWRAFGSKAYNDNFDNQETIKKIIKLKYDRANLLGYKNHAEFTLEERMAQNSSKVLSFLDSLYAPTIKAAKADLDELKKYISTLKNENKVEELMPWDVSFYSEKLKESKYSFNEEEVRPYFKLENVIDGVFEHAKKLYGLSFKEIKNIPTYHPDVKTYEVRDEKTNEYVSLFYADFFPRETKKGGAWMTSYREQGLYFGKVRRPHVSIVCNFTKPTPTKPSLLTLDEVHTLFHEFGHALHGMLSNCHYRSVSGTNVYWDFVELPSQIMENWVTEKESLDLFAKHYQTDEKIPAELVEKIRASKKFQAGWFGLRQLQFGLLDMSWYTTNPNEISDIDAFEDKATESTSLLPKIKGTNKSCSFSHIFAGGYSAGYYSYKWAEVLDADAFEYFKEKGLFNQEVASKFKNFVLSKGGSEHPMELYKKFRGREPDANALLRRDGLLN